MVLGVLCIVLPAKRTLDAQQLYRSLCRPVTHNSSQLESTGSSPLLPTTLESTINNYLVPVSSITVDMFFITLEYVATTTPHSRLATKLENESR